MRCVRMIGSSTQGIGGDGATQRILEDGRPNEESCCRVVYTRAMQSAAKTVDQYLAEPPADRRAALESSGAGGRGITKAKGARRGG